MGTSQMGTGVATAILGAATAAPGRIKCLNAANIAAKTYQVKMTFPDVAVC